ncbi:MAG: hypothetical protein DCC69_05025 [Hyphomicrobiales bacterium]|nr:MAG: hypothetical protein DCC69_05025 [Hyphomicrobiales bacterium]
MSAAAGDARRFPWDELIGLGLGLLRLAPRDFWAATPREMAHVLRLYAGSGGEAGPPGRQSLLALMALFPDDKER